MASLRRPRLSGPVILSLTALILTLGAQPNAVFIGAMGPSKPRLAGVA